MSPRWRLSLPALLFSQDMAPAFWGVSMDFVRVATSMKHDGKLNGMVPYIATTVRTAACKLVKGQTPGHKSLLSPLSEEIGARDGRAC